MYFAVGIPLLHIVSNTIVLENPTRVSQRAHDEVKDCYIPVCGYCTMPCTVVVCSVMMWCDVHIVHRNVSICMHTYVILWR